MGNYHYFYFVIVIIAVLATGIFTVFEAANTVTHVALIEGSLYNIVRSGDARLLANINQSIDGNFNVLDEEFNNIDEEINGL